ncbi:hypothetical protein [Actinokineospora sp. UTMC 2448]|uniref:hypothetical protein n=1 Tax=Actinokineospora sp. UTMC 2448 TaxID=2268449 RepID=UPI002164696F|nr:hypothetical protein [Actinokineospora sp. UTMC 2448]UVS81829.1 hypothetical protein Actkin_05593 [Actinokineospora sp. UTMC 2448]
MASDSDPYGWDHQQYRAAHRDAAYGQPCSRCRQVMDRDGEPIELDHWDDRPGYRGFSHRSCNRRAGALKRMGRLPPEGTTSRDW